MDRISTFVIPGKTGEISQCSLQITSMLHEKPSETFAVASATRKIETDIIRKVKYIGLLQVNPALRPIEIITSVYKIAFNETILFFDGDASISPKSLRKLLDAHEKEPNAVYCSALKEMGDTEGFVYGSFLGEEGKAKPIISDKKRNGIDLIDCLQYGCILAPKKILSKISADSPCASIEDMSCRIADIGTQMFCVNESFISYKGLINLGIEVTNA